MSEDRYKKALEMAAKQLSYRALSSKQLFDKLTAKDFTENEAEYAVAWLTERGLLSDNALAQSIVRSYANKGYGTMRIKQELAKRGIEREQTDEVMQEFSPNMEKMIALLDKKLHGDLSDRKQVDKAVASLARRGYLWDDIKQAVKEYGIYCIDDQ